MRCCLHLRGLPFFAALFLHAILPTFHACSTTAVPRTYPYRRRTYTRLRPTHHEPTVGPVTVPGAAGPPAARGQAGAGTGTNSMPGIPAVPLHHSPTTWTWDVLPVAAKSGNIPVPACPPHPCTLPVSRPIYLPPHCSKPPARLWLPLPYHLRQVSLPTHRSASSSRTYPAPTPFTLYYARAFRTVPDHLTVTRREPRYTA